MNTLYVIGGIILLIYGVWQTIITTKVFLNDKHDWLGADIKILGSAIMAIMIGIYLLFKYI